MARVQDNITRLRKQTEAAKAALAVTKTMTPGEIRYATWNGSFHVIKAEKRGDATFKLSNFTAEICEEITEFDGAKTDKVFRISGQLENGQPLPEIDLPADKLEGMTWVTEHWGSAAQINVGTKFKDHVLAAMKQHSQPKHTHVALHTGWVQNRDEHIYLTGSGAITAQGLDQMRETKLCGSLQDYDLPPPYAEEISAQDIEHLIGDFEMLLPGGVGLLCLGAVFRAVLSHFEPTTVSVYLAGVTGTRKSAVAGVLQSFWGKELNGSNLPANWSSTGNSLEKQAFLTKDALLVVDDFVARGTPAEVARVHRTAEQLLRGQANQAGRQRLTSTAELREAYHSRGLIVATGEDIPNGHSLQARTVLIGIEKCGVNLDTLTELQEKGQSGELSQVMSNFIQWIAIMAFTGNFGGTFVQQRRRRLKTEIGQGGHTRTPYNLAELLCGLSVFLLWAKSIKLIDENDEKRIMQMATSSAKTLALAQAEVDHESSDAQRFIDLMKSALQTGRAHVASMSGMRPRYHLSLGWRDETAPKGDVLERSQGDRIGWVDDRYLYIELSSALAVVKRLSTDLGNHLGASGRAISKALKEANWLAITDEGRNTVKVTCAGSRRQVLCLDLNQVMDLQIDEKASSYDEDLRNIPF